MIGAVACVLLTIVLFGVYKYSLTDGVRALEEIGTKGRV
jgi:hypothetical protein